MLLDTEGSGDFEQHCTGKTEDKKRKRIENFVRSINVNKIFRKEVE
ncbi:hypothetical protein MAR_004029 [Mya arenaria]|uniref:Uncharacterized protein n=1 Tax=Mya arenaria TaxID=6604 RepID=A0ABY7EZN9_MYAAR|nr:hypothetical protein MAR_004029 [Mya arenaria]